MTTIKPNETCGYTKSGNKPSFDTWMRWLNRRILPFCGCEVDELPDTEPLYDYWQDGMSPSQAFDCIVDSLQDYGLGI